MLSSSKVSFWKGHFGGSSYIVSFKFLCWTGQKFCFWKGGHLGVRTPDDL